MKLWIYVTSRLCLSIAAHACWFQKYSIIPISLIYSGRIWFRDVTGLGLAECFCGSYGPIYTYIPPNSDHHLEQHVSQLHAQRTVKHVNERSQR